MSNYKETSVTGESWVRSHRVVIENPYGGIPAIHFSEEQVINLGLDTIKKHISDVSENLTNPSQVFSIVDPSTGVVTGETATYGQVYALLHSLYLDLAAKRDAAP